MTEDAKRFPLVDTHGRRISYLRLSVTDLCNLRCSYCMPDGVVNKLRHEDVLRFEESIEVVQAAASLGVVKVRVTGGEPLVKRGIVGLVEKLTRIEGIETVVMTTNAVRLEEMAAGLKDAGLSGINVSLDSLDPDIYAAITRGGDLRVALRGIDRALELGFPVKMNVVLLSDQNTEELYRFIEFARSGGIGLRFIERMVFDESHPLFSQDDAVAQLSTTYPVEPLSADPAQPHVRRFQVDGFPVGFISPMTHSFCDSCNKLRLTSEGKLRMCLASPEAVDMKALLRRPHSFEDIKNAVLQAVRAKPKAAPWNAPGEMWRVGG